MPRGSGGAPGRRRGGRKRRWPGVVALALAAAGLLWWWSERPIQKPTPEQIRGTAPPRPGLEDPPRSAEPPADASTEPLSPAPREPAGHLALVVDDLGRSLDELEALDALGIPLSWAVLPFESRTEEVVAWLAREPREVLCHLPMAASNGADPGPGALSAAMDARELAARTELALDRVPIAVGVNNHMGSEVTADRRAVEAVLEVVRARELFFLDSRTSPSTVAYETARAMGIPAAERQVFLDADGSPEGIREQFERWKTLARERGAAVAIAHPRPETLAVLREEIPRAREAGYVFVPVSFLLDRAGGLE